MRHIVTRRGAYHDSVQLMLLTKGMEAQPGVRRAMAAMATPTNLEILETLGWTAADAAGAGADDLLIAVDAADEASVEAALEWFDEELGRRRQAGTTAYRPKTLRRALADYPDAGLVQISVPGAYAYREARRALRADRDVMLFSDNVPVEEEVALKTLAEARGKLLMGPDCGTAVLGGVCLGFSNVVPRGPVGIVAASGTGAQEVSTLLARWGVGISDIIGTGGRDLSREVGGRMMRMGIRRLAADPRTEVIVLVSKPPAAEVADAVLGDARDAGKPVVVCFLGKGSGPETAGPVSGARTLEDAARLAAGKTGIGMKADESGEPRPCGVKGETSRWTDGQRYLRGLFVGGTLADEAMFLLRDALGEVYSNGPVAGCLPLPEGGRSRGHTILDLGADEFTVGRAHPMIDPTLRNLRIEEEAGDPETAVLLLDIVLGYGSHPDPAGVTARAVERARTRAARDGRHLVVAASVCGTEGDPQNAAEQEKILGRAGVHVFSSNAAACRYCRTLLGGNAEETDG